MSGLLRSSRAPAITIVMTWSRSSRSLSASPAGVRCCRRTPRRSGRAESSVPTKRRALMSSRTIRSIVWRAVTKEAKSARTTSVSGVSRGSP